MPSSLVTRMRGRESHSRERPGACAAARAAVPGAGRARRAARRARRSTSRRSTRSASRGDVLARPRLLGRRPSGDRPAAPRVIGRGWLGGSCAGSLRRRRRSASAAARRPADADRRRLWARARGGPRARRRACAARVVTSRGTFALRARKCWKNAAMTAANGSAKTAPATPAILMPDEHRDEHDDRVDADRCGHHPRLDDVHDDEPADGHARSASAGRPPAWSARPRRQAAPSDTKGPKNGNRLQHADERRRGGQEVEPEGEAAWTSAAMRPVDHALDGLAADEAAERRRHARLEQARLSLYCGGTSRLR